jgi:spore coat protein A, manganese oxidase
MKTCLHSAVHTIMTVLVIILIGATSPTNAQPNLPSYNDPMGRFLEPIADPTLFPKFVNNLPIVSQLGLRVDATAPGTHLTVTAEPVLWDILGDGHQTKMLGFKFGNGITTHPGATIIAKKNVPLTVTWMNNLGFSYPVIVDTSIMNMYSDPPYIGRTIANNGVPFVPHLHGGHTDAIYDGLPDQWWTPLYHTTSNPLAKGADFVTNIFTYDNTQEQATLWYHDHSHGITRLNAYMGMAGFYFIRDDNELGMIAANQLPSGDKEIELAIQDKFFFPNGQIALPDIPSTNRGIATDIMQPELFANFICVNGKAWPKLAVDPVKYRFRVLNASDSRFYNMWLQKTDGTRVPITEIGTEDGFLNAPVTRDSLLIGCGERYDIVIDFAGLQGQSIIVMNNAGGPYGNAAPDPVEFNASDRIMRFDVNNVSVADPVTLPASLRAPIVPLVQTGPTRELILAETQDKYGRTMPMLGTVSQGAKSYMEPTTETIKLNDTEVWKVYNTTADGHPIHLHLVAFQVLSRQAFTAIQDPVTLALSNIQLIGSPQSMPDHLKGPKDTQVMYPGEVTTLIAHFDKSGTYVWHCHILSHEEWDMMRKFYVRHPLVAPLLTSPINLGTGIAPSTAFSWNSVLDAATYRIQIATNPSFLNPIVDQAGIAATSFTPASPLSAGIVHYWRVSASNVDGTGPWSDIFSFTTSDAGAPVHFAFTGYTGSSLTMVIPNTAELFLDGIPLVSGDEIGVFNAASLCVGAVVWHGTSTAFSIWGDNASLPGINGMLDGDTLYFRFWKPSTGLEYIGASPCFESGAHVFINGASTIMHSLTAYTYLQSCQQYIIPPGWSMASTYMRIWFPSIDRVTQPIIDNLGLIKDGNGQVFWPGMGGSLTTWSTVNGYQIFMAHGDTISFMGDIQRPETTPMALPRGWNLVAYLRYSPLSPVAAFQTIGAGLGIAKDNYGQVFWPAYGINTISNLMPGQAYQLYLLAPSVLTYPANTVLPPNGIDMLQPRFASTAHYLPTISRTGATATLLVRFTENVADMDEVAARNQRGELIGTGSIEKQKAVMTLWGDDVSTKVIDGALNGEAVILSHWSASEKIEKYLTVVKLEDGCTGKALGAKLTYQTDAILIADVARGALVPTSVAQSGIVPTDFVLEQNYPNPFNPATRITYGLPRDGRVSLEVFDVLGRRVAVLVDEEKTAGYHDAMFDASRLTSGVYMYRIAAGDFVQVRKMMLVR